MTAEWMRTVLGLYLGAAAMLAVAWAIFHAGLATIELFGFDALVSMRGRVRLGRVTILRAIAAWPLASVLPKHHAFAGAGIFWRDALYRVEGRDTTGATTSIATAVQRSDQKDHAQGGVDVMAILAIFLLAGALTEGAWARRNAVRIRKALAVGLVFRRQGHLSLMAMPDDIVPFAVKHRGRAIIALPTSTLADRDALRVALRHEGQHHRHGDTFWLRALALLPAFFPLNPFARLWRRTFQDLHELACDEALVGRRRLDARIYGRCLVEAAEKAFACRSSLSGTASMASGKDGSQPKNTLERRLAMFSRHQSFGTGTATFKRRMFLGCGAIATTLGVVAIAYAAQGAARTHAPLSKNEAQALAAQIPMPADFHLTVNDLVLARLNKVITDPRRAESLKKSLERMEDYKPQIQAALNRFGFPEALLAVPLVESGYLNSPNPCSAEAAGSPMGAGLWMVICKTGHRYGLVINGTTDERLNVEKETDAALRLLAADRLRFNDWMLALAAYNEGEGHVDQAIQRGKTRNAWALVERGELNDYLVLTTAGIILMNHPELVE